MKSLLALVAVVLLTSNFSMAQEPQRNIGVSVILKPKLGMSFEYDQALQYYTTKFRKDAAWAIRVTRVSGGPRSGCDILTQPLKTWTELDGTKPYQTDSAGRAWQNVLKYCDDVQVNYYQYDEKNSNALTEIPSTAKYVSYNWVLDPKADSNAFEAEFKKVGPLLKAGGYNFSITKSLTGDTRFQVLMQLPNGFKDLDKKMPGYKELFLKAYPAKGAYEAHSAIMDKSTGDFFIEYRAKRNTMSTR